MQQSVSLNQRKRTNSFLTGACVSVYLIHFGSFIITSIFNFHVSYFQPKKPHSYTNISGLNKARLQSSVYSHSLRSRALEARREGEETGESLNFPLPITPSAPKTHALLLKEIKRRKPTLIKRFDFKGNGANNNACTTKICCNICSKMHANTLRFVMVYV